MHARIFAAVSVLLSAFSTAHAQEGATSTDTVVNISLSEGLEVRKSFVRVDLVASVRGPDLERLQSEIDQAIEPFKSAKVKSESTAIILGDRTANVSSLNDVSGALGPFWTLQQRIIIQGLDQRDVLSFAQRPHSGVEINSINYSVPIELQKKTEADVTDLVLKSLATRANAIMTSLNGNSVSVTDVRVVTKLQNDESENQPPGMQGSTAARAYGDAGSPQSTFSNADAQTLVNKALSSPTAVITADVSATFVVRH